MLLLGTQDKIDQLIQVARTHAPYLFIANNATADVFAQEFPDAAPFSYRNHSFDIRRDYQSVREFADIAFPDKDLMTYLHGKQELATMLFENPIPLTELTGDSKDPAVAEAHRMVDGILLSPILRNVLTRRPNFSFDRSVIANLDGLYYDDARKLAALLISRHKGHIIIPEFDVYGRPLHISLIREKRLTAGLQTLSQAPEGLREPLLTIPEKCGSGCTYEDALELAKHAGLIPGVRNHTDFVDERMHFSPNPELG